MTFANTMCRLRSLGWQNMRHMPTRAIAELKRVSRRPQRGRFQKFRFWPKRGQSRHRAFGIVFGGSASARTKMWLERVQGTAYHPSHGAEQPPVQAEKSPSVASSFPCRAAIRSAGPFSR